MTFGSPHQSLMQHYGLELDVLQIQITMYLLNAG